MEVGHIVNVKGSAFIAVAAPNNKCQGCAGHRDSGSGITCVKFPSCVDSDKKYLHFVRHDPNPSAQPWMPPLALHAPAACDIGPSLPSAWAGLSTTPARKTDPATSKGKRKVNKYEQAVTDAIKNNDYFSTLWCVALGLTGKEIAIETGHPLNCITPRFAPLRRKGLIKDSGIKRDKQIVWVLA